MEDPIFDLETLARRHHSRLIHHRGEIDKLGANFKGFSLGILADAMAIPELLASYLNDKVQDAISLLRLGQNAQEDIQHGSTIMIPGYAASNRHLDTLTAHLGVNTVNHPHFEKRKLTERVFEDAEILADNIIRGGKTVQICAHSRGGLVALCMMQILQDRHQDHLISNVVLLSPTSHGIRSEITSIAQQLGIEAIEDLCQGSDAVNFWQRLNPMNRAKIQIVSQEGGDGFTSPNQSFVDGSTMLIAPHCGHQNGIRDPSTEYFQLAIELIEHPIVISD